MSLQADRVIYADNKYCRVATPRAIPKRWGETTGYSIVLRCGFSYESGLIIVRALKDGGEYARWRRGCEFSWTPSQQRSWPRRPVHLGEQNEHAIRSSVGHRPLGRVRPGRNAVTLRKVAAPGSTQLRANRSLVERHHQHRLVPRAVFAPSTGLPNNGLARRRSIEHPMRRLQAALGMALCRCKE